MSEKFERLAAKHKDAVYAQMVRVCGNHDDAEDVLVEALVKAYESLDQLREVAHFRAWLATIGRRVCANVRRKEALLPILDLEHPPEIPVEDDQFALSNEALHSFVSQTLEDMPDIYREVYRMRELEGIPAEEVARTLNLSVGAVKTRLHRARAFVRERLDKCVECQGEELPTVS
ncbi:RNA polymerase sigma factor [Kamptonema cortianum]|nr:RNA polymerase sigma factor [Geitlerinema splendidum]MDK3162193.1 RNA polymerase sigma factor [Kamptonema cortianum]